MFEQNRGFSKVSSSHATLWLQLAEYTRSWFFVAVVFPTDLSLASVFPRYPPNLGDGVFARRCLMFVQHVSCWRRLAWLCLPVALWPFLALSRLGSKSPFHNSCLLFFLLLKFWGFLTSGNHTKPQRETQLKPPGFTCFCNKTRRGAEFALERFGDLWKSFHTILGG